MCDQVKLGDVQRRLRILGPEAERLLSLVDGDITLSRDAARFRLALEVLTLGVDARLRWMDAKTSEQDAASSPRTEQET